MTQITEEKKRLLQFYANRYCHQSPSACQKQTCTCRLMAQYRSFLNLTVPGGYRDLTINDFTGEINGKQCIHPKIAVEAKKQIASFCWGEVTLNQLNNMSESDRNQSSVMGHRMKNGNNVVIHGEAKRVLESSDDNGYKILSSNPMGRTFVASLLTKEAIKLKIEREHCMRNFEWVEFSDLIQSLKNDEENSIHYEDCDWLVIDNITEHILQTSPTARSYLVSLIDPFFSHRIARKRSTVLVFQFDAHKKREDIESNMGMSVGKIIDNQSTYTIMLTDKDTAYGGK